MKLYSIKKILPVIVFKIVPTLSEFIPSPSFKIPMINLIISLVIIYVII